MPTSQVISKLHIPGCSTVAKTAVFSQFSECVDTATSRSARIISSVITSCCYQHMVLSTTKSTVICITVFNNMLKIMISVGSLDTACSTFKAM